MIGAAVFPARALASVFTFPPPRSLLNVAYAAILLDAAVVGLGVSSGLYRWQPLNARSLGWSAVYLALRTVLEEFVFRAVLLPHPKVDGAESYGVLRYMMSSVLPIIMFVASHLWTTQRTPGAVISDVKFLSTLGLCGMACTWAYWVCSGSFAAACCMHFMVVYPWMTLLGGWKKSHTPTPMKGAARRQMAPAEAQEYAAKEEKAM